jgi:hypothetical protein
MLSSNYIGYSINTGNMLNTKLTQVSTVHIRNVLNTRFSQKERTDYPHNASLNIRNCLHSRSTGARLYFTHVLVGLVIFSLSNYIYSCFQFHVKKMFCSSLLTYVLKNVHVLLMLFLLYTDYQHTFNIIMCSSGFIVTR